MAKRTAQDLRLRLQHQLDALISSCNGFYEGHDFEVPRIAVAIATIVNTSRGKTVSLLEQTGLRDRQYFLSCRGTWDERVKPKMPLASFVPTHDEMVFCPPKTLPLYNFMRLRPFHEWWNEPVYADSNGSTWTRKKLVTIFRNKLGAHIDIYDEPKSFLEAHAGRTSGVSKTKGSPLAVTVWHIGMELVLSISRTSEWSSNLSTVEIWRRMERNKAFSHSGVPWGHDPSGRAISTVRFAWQADGEPVPSFNDEPY